MKEMSKRKIKLLAELLGWMESSGGEYFENYNDEDTKILPYWIPSDSNLIEAKNMRFDKSWDWCMIVISKFNELDKSNMDSAVLYDLTAKLDWYIKSINLRQTAEIIHSLIQAYNKTQNQKRGY